MSNLYSPPPSSGMKFFALQRVQVLFKAFCVDYYDLSVCLSTSLRVVSKAAWSTISTHLIWAAIISRLSAIDHKR